ncbi:MAG: DNA-directed RNA polymerase subunit omega [Oscillospiraceae bacterium]
MHRPSVSEILHNNESYYSLVVAVAKRARIISDEASEKGEILIDKPVNIAVHQFADGIYKLIETPDIGSKIE